MTGELPTELAREIATALSARGHGTYGNLVYVLAAVAGQITQSCVIRARVTSGEPLAPPDVAAVGTTDGRTYLFGDAISRALLGVGNEPGVLWEVADAAGLAFDRRMIDDLFAHAARTVGGEAYGRPRTDVGVSALLTIDRAVRHTPMVVERFTRRGIAERLWPRMTALATRHALTAAVAKGSDGVALGRVALDAAVAGSHVRLDEPGKR